MKKAASYKKPFTATIATDQGDVVVDMAAAKAPCTTNSFKHLAQAMHGSVRATSELNVGTTFAVSLPLADP